MRGVPRKWFRLVGLAVERVTIPGVTLHYVLRKRYLEELAREALDEGFKQVVILGAGYDTLALRLHRQFPGVLFVEIDHPATQRVKRQALESRDLPNPNMKFLAVDFARQSLKHSLRTFPKYNPEANTLFVAEGVLMYLRPDEVASIFGLIRGGAGPMARFAFTFMEPQADGKIAFKGSSRLVDLWLRVMGESFTWGIRREDLPGYLEAKGFSLRGLATPDTFRARYLVSGRSPKVRLPDGEYVCVADRL